MSSTYEEFLKWKATNQNTVNSNQIIIKSNKEEPKINPKVEEIQLKNSNCTNFAKGIGKGNQWSNWQVTKNFRSSSISDNIERARYGRESIQGEDPEAKEARRAAFITSWK
jgi:hypothetical protein